MTTIAEAEQTRTDLRAKLDAARVALNEMDARRTEIAFEAHANGGDAKKELDKLNKARATHIAEIESLEVAHQEASRRVADAERIEAMKEDSGRAERALAVRDRLLARAKKLDEALAAIAEEGNGFRADLRELNHQLGCSHPHEHQFESLGERAVKAGLMASPFRIEHLAPRERHTFVELADSWALTIERWAEARLVKPETTEAA